MSPSKEGSGRFPKPSKATLSIFRCRISCDMTTVNSTFQESSTTLTGGSVSHFPVIGYSANTVEELHAVEGNDSRDSSALFPCKCPVDS